VTAGTMKNLPYAEPVFAIHPRSSETARQWERKLAEQYPAYADMENAANNHDRYNRENVAGSVLDNQERRLARLQKTRDYIKACGEVDNLGAIAFLLSVTRDTARNYIHTLVAEGCITVRNVRVHVKNEDGTTTYTRVTRMTWVGEA